MYLATSGGLMFISGPVQDRSTRAFDGDLFAEGSIGRTVPSWDLGDGERLDQFATCIVPTMPLPIAHM